MIALAILIFQHKPCFQNLRNLEALLLQMPEKRIVAVRSVAYAEFSCHTGVHLPFLQIGSRLCPLLLLQGFIKEPPCQGVHFK